MTSLLLHLDSMTVVPALSSYVLMTKGYERILLNIKYLGNVTKGINYRNLHDNYILQL